MSNRAVANGQAKSAILILSDMWDTSGDEESDDRLMDQFTQYIQTGGVIGMYYVSQDEYFKWRERFSAPGFEKCVLEMDIHGRPPLPSFEQ